MEELKIYFSDFFDVDEDIIESYGAVNISLINDMPLFAMKSPPVEGAAKHPAALRCAEGLEKAVCQTEMAGGSGSQPRAWSRFKYALILCSRWKPS